MPILRDYPLSSCSEPDFLHEWSTLLPRRSLTPLTPVPPEISLSAPTLPCSHGVSEGPLTFSHILFDLSSCGREDLQDNTAYKLEAQALLVTERFYFFTK